MKDQFQRFGEMKTIRYHYFRVIFFQRYDNWLVVKQREYLFSVNNNPDPQETQQYLVTPGNDYIIGSMTQLCF